MTKTAMLQVSPESRNPTTYRSAKAAVGCSAVVRRLPVPEPDGAAHDCTDDADTNLRRNLSLQNARFLLQLDLFANLPATVRRGLGCALTSVAAFARRFCYAQFPED
jgi:hypothetical protein